MRVTLGGRKGAVLLLALVAAAAGLRTWTWSRNGSAYLPTVEPEEGYYEQGVGLLSHGVLSMGLSGADPALWRGPVFPTFLALSEAPFKKPWVSHPRLAQGLLSALAVGFAFWLGGFLGGRFAAWAAAVLLAFDAGQMLSASSLNVHAFYGLVLLGLAGAAAWWARSPTPKRGLLLGAALGGSLLVRSTHFLSVPLILLAGMPPRRGKVQWHLGAWPLAALLLVLLPWTARNALFFKVFQPLDSYSGAVNLYAASRGKVQTSVVEEAVEWAAEEDPRIRTVYASDRPAVFPRLLHLAARRIAAAPLAYLRGVVTRWFDLFLPWLPVFALALFAAWRRKSRAVWAAFSVLVSLSAYALIAVQASYADCLRPLAAVFCGLALAELPSLSRRRTAPTKEEAKVSRALAAAYSSVFAVVLLASVLLLAREAAVAGPWSPRRSEGTAKVFAVNDSRAEKLLRALANQDATGILWTRLGVFDDMTGDHKRACTEFLRASRFSAQRDAVRPFLVDCLLAGGRLSDARRAADASVAAAKDPASLAAALTVRARVLLSAHQDAAAQRDLKRAQALAPSDPRVQRAAIEADLAARRWPSAEKRLRAALASAAKPSDRAELGLGLAGLLWRRSASAEADAAFSAALRADPDRACRSSGNLADVSALPPSYFDHCLSSYPGDARLLADRGVSLWIAGRRADAVSSFRAALASDPGDLATALSLSAALGPVPESRRILADALRVTREPPATDLRAAAEKALKSAR